MFSIELFPSLSPRHKKKFKKLRRTFDANLARCLVALRRFLWSFLCEGWGDSWNGDLGLLEAKQPTSSHQRLHLDSPQWRESSISTSWKIQTITEISVRNTTRSNFKVAKISMFLEDQSLWSALNIRLPLFQALKIVCFEKSSLICETDRREWQGQSSLADDGELDLPSSANIQLLPLHYLHTELFFRK